MTQESLEQAVKSKITNGYLSVDNKNTLIWASITALFIFIGAISYSSGYTTAHATCVTTKLITDSLHNR